MRTDLLIVGGGIAGLSTAYWAARRGLGEVTLVERAARPGMEATRQNASILRCHATDPVILELGIRGGDLLRVPPPDLGSDPFVDDRGLVLTGAGAAAERLEAQFASLPEKARVRRLDAAQLRDRVPYLRAPAEIGLDFPHEGEIDVPRLLDSLERAVVASGVELRFGSGVLRLLREGSTVVGAELESGERIGAHRTVLAAGAWAGRLGAAAGSQVSLRPTRRHLLVSSPDPGVEAGWPAVWLEDRRAYARPEAGGMLLCACDTDEVLDPDRLGLHPGEADRILSTASECFRGLRTEAHQRFWAGLRTFAPDKRFVVGPDPNVDGLHWVAGLGGHGMGTGLEVGRLAAASLGGAHDDRLLAHLDPGRQLQGRA